MPTNIQLTKMNVGYCSDPNQSIIAAQVNAEIEVNVSTDIDVSEGALYRQGLTPSVTAILDLPPSTVAEIIPDTTFVTVTRTILGVAGLVFTLSDGDGGEDSHTLSLTAVPPLSTETITITDVTATGFDEALVIGDVIMYSTTTNIESSAVQVSELGRVQITGTYTPGDSFTYQINSDPLQTYTFE